MEGSRLEAVLCLLNENTSTSISEIAVHFGVSQMTIRRDLQKLAEQGLVIRTPGGARIERWGGLERTFIERLEKMSQAKRAIGRAAAEMVQDGESLILDSGTTTLYVARALRELRRQKVAVFTFSIAVLEELAAAEEIHIELTGGAYRASSRDLIGRGVAEGLKSIYADYVIFGAAAVSFSRGVMVHDLDAQRDMLQSGKQKILLADSSKIGKEATYQLCAIEACDLIITDEMLPEGDLIRLRRMTKVLVASGLPDV